MSRELGKGTRNEEGIGERSAAQRRSRRERVGLNDGRSDWKQIGMRGEGEGSGTKLRSDRQPGNSAVREQEVTACASGGRGSEARVGGWW
jgi:hypothetical protein